eukprot:TRINITY_DN3969_c0_g3_i1.p1 TRINITY_DN3969_c0_g3~~TRINITY_DN3969_c0_g3_i1.p1  ORF type:complete len:437 (+),score=107.28 TRINITY_DN3969_c0_g3_i1:125-1312(+)
MGLSHPIQSKMLFRHGDAKFRVGGASMQGYRPEMEDAESIHLSLKNHPNIALFGVFDGHNGSAASQWLHQNLHQYIDKLDDPFSPEQLKKAMLQADADFLATDNKHNGSTCVFALVDHSGPKPWKLLVANIGDSRALISRNGNTVALTKDHKPTNDEELSRIRAAGGYVEFGRVDGQLALSRAVGDSPYKQNKSLPLDKQRVIAVPDITLDQLSDEDVLIVCCDGIFEAISNEETVRFTHEKVQESPDDPAYVAAQLLDSVLKKGSRDNTTAIVIQTKDGTTFNHGAQFYPGPIQAFRDDPWFVDAYTKNAQFYGLTLEDAMRRLEELKKTGAGPLVAATSIITGTNADNAASSSSSSGSTDGAAANAALVAENEEAPASDSMDVDQPPAKPELL